MSDAHAVPARTITPPLSTGEVNFLWWFIQGSLMNAPVREDLRRGWGPCERHALALLVVENALRPHYLHGPVILFHDLMKRAVAAYAYAWPLHDLRTRHALTPTRPCHFCAMGIDASTTGDLPHERYLCASDETNLRAFMAKTYEGWRSWVCPTCTGAPGSVLCRRHILEVHEAWAQGAFEDERARIGGLAEHLGRYERAFAVDYQGTDTIDDRAALIAAAGWVAGWGQLWDFWTADSSSERASQYDRGGQHTEAEAPPR